MLLKIAAAVRKTEAVRRIFTEYQTAASLCTRMATALSVERTNYGKNLYSDN